MSFQKGRMATVLVIALGLTICTASVLFASMGQTSQNGPATYGWCNGGGGGGYSGGGYNGGGGYSGGGKACRWGSGSRWKGGGGIGWCNGMWGGQYGSQTSQFMAHGTIVSISGSTITINLDGASPSLLSELGLTAADLPSEVSLQMTSTVKVWGCGWYQSKWGSGQLTVDNLNPGDTVNLMGYFDQSSGTPLVSRINVWYY